MEPLPFYALVRTRGPGTHLDPAKPLAVGVVVGMSQSVAGWHYAVSIGETSYAFDHSDLIFLGCVVDPMVIYGDDAELLSTTAVCRLI